MKTVIIFLSCWTLTLLSYGSNELHGIVKKVADGNTIIVSTPDNEDQKVFLHGIDSPEMGQLYAEQAKAFLEKLLLNKKVTIYIRGKDRYGNRLGEIKIDDTIDPRKELIQEGLAWTSEEESNPELEAIKVKARALGKGLWSEADPTPPWIYRRQLSMAQPKTS